MSLIVQKFGGSSVANAERVFNVAKIVTDTYKKGNNVVVVVSAQGDTTDDLIEKANEINPDASKREKDMLLDAGEQISISLLAMAIEKLGYPVISLLGWQAGFQTTSAYTSARIKRVRTDRIAKELDKSYERLLGKYVKVNNFAFKVVGIYKEDESEQTMEAFCPFTTFKTMFGKGDKVGNIIFTFHGINTLEESEAFENKYRQKINRNHDAAPDDESALWIWNRTSDSIQMDTGISIIRTALWIIGLLTLLSGIVGISNIMLITVKERTHEFGIRKAIGAKPMSILKLIITESIIITSFFGYVGMMAGILANEWMDATIGHETMDMGIYQETMFLNPTVGLDVCIEATVIMIVAGTIAGIIPAWKAARIRPIKALMAN